MNEPLEKTTSNDHTAATSDKIAMYCLFILFECGRPSALPSRCPLGGIETIRFGRGKTRKIQRTYEKGSWYLDVFVPDEWMSSAHARITCGIESWLLEDGPSKNGSFVNGVRRERALLKDGDVLELGHTFFVFRRLWLDKGENLEAGEAPPVPEVDTIVPDVRRELVRLALTAKSGLSILLTGETGTGKEMLARAVHKLSRRSGAFTAINCGALASSVLEAELFGVNKGAFTGADRDRDGLVRAANNGTLFLDEIGELPLTSQAAFLRVLQEREVVPVGGSHPIRVDFRLMSATNRDLTQQVTAGAFRADLLSRISGFTIRVPAMRERREDLALLIPALLARQAKPPTEAQRFTPRAIRALLLYHWPMNVREVEKCLEAAVILAQGAPIDIDDLPEAIRRGLSFKDFGPRSTAASEAPVADVDGLSARERKLRETLVGMLRAHRGNVSEVARAMSKGRTQVRRWIRKLELDPDSFRGE